MSPERGPPGTLTDHLGESLPGISLAQGHHNDRYRHYDISQGIVNQALEGKQEQQKQCVLRKTTNSTVILSVKRKKSKALSLSVEHNTQIRDVFDSAKQGAQA